VLIFCLILRNFAATSVMFTTSDIAAVITVEADVRPVIA
jgi:hypothetical protein